jgi:hypothetical protein
MNFLNLLQFWNRCFVLISLLPSTAYLARNVRTVKFFTMQFYPICYYFISARSKYSPQDSFSNALNLEMQYCGRKWGENHVSVSVHCNSQEEGFRGFHNNKGEVQRLAQEPEKPDLYSIPRGNNLPSIEELSPAIVRGNLNVICRILDWQKF